MITEWIILTYSPLISLQFSISCQWLGPIDFFYEKSYSCQFLFIFSWCSQDFIPRLLWHVLFQFYINRLKGFNGFLFSFIQLNLLSTYFIRGMPTEMFFRLWKHCEDQDKWNVCSHKAYILVEGDRDKQVNECIKYFHIMIEN